MDALIDRGPSRPLFRGKAAKFTPPRRGGPSPQGDSDPWSARDRNRSNRLGSPTGKLAKLHGSIPFSELRVRHDGPGLCGILAHAAGLVDAPAPCSPADLVAAFDWRRVPEADRVARWGQHGLAIEGAAPR